MSISDPYPGQSIQLVGTMERRTVGIRINTNVASLVQVRTSNLDDYKFVVIPSAIKSLTDLLREKGFRITEYLKTPSKRSTPSSDNVQLRMRIKTGNCAPGKSSTDTKTSIDWGGNLSRYNLPDEYRRDPEEEKFYFDSTL